MDLSIQFRFSYPSTCSCGAFCLWLSAFINCDSLYPPFCLSNFWRSNLTCNLTSLIDIKIVVCLFSFLVVRLECQVLSSWHAGLEIHLWQSWRGKVYHMIRNKDCVLNINISNSNRPEYCFLEPERNLQVSICLGVYPNLE